MRPGYTQTDVTHPVLGWGGANVALQHLGRIPNCSEVPDTFFCGTFYNFAIIIIAPLTFANLRIRERKGCCISVNLRLKIRISFDQKHSNTIVEWPKRHGMLHYCEFAIESTDFPCPKALKYHSAKWG